MTCINVSEVEHWRGILSTNIWKNNSSVVVVKGFIAHFLESSQPKTNPFLFSQNLQHKQEGNMESKQ